MMKRTLIILLSLAAGLSAFAQSGTEKLQAMLEGHRVSFDYTVTSLDKVPVTVTGHAVLDGDCYALIGGGVDVYNDGTSKWTVDNEACEVYIEHSVGTKEFLASPLEYLRFVSNLKVSDSTVSGTFKSEEAGLAFNFTFTGLQTAPLSGSTEGFVFDTSALPNGWLVNDLRW